MCINIKHSIFNSKYGIFNPSGRNIEEHSQAPSPNTWNTSLWNLQSSLLILSPPIFVVRSWSFVECFTRNWQAVWRPEPQSSNWRNPGPHSPPGQSKTGFSPLLICTQCRHKKCCPIGIVPKKPRSKYKAEVATSCQRLLHTLARINTREGLPKPIVLNDSSRLQHCTDVVTHSVARATMAHQGEHNFPLSKLSITVKLHTSLSKLQRGSILCLTKMFITTLLRPKVVNF